MHLARLTLALLTAAAITSAAAPAVALEPIDFDLAAPASASAHAKPVADDEDEDAFFSSGPRQGTVVYTGTIAPHGPQQRLPSPRPQVDVAATCRAVLADNLNLYNSGFIESCKRAVTSSHPRRFVTR